LPAPGFGGAVAIDAHQDGIGITNTKEASLRRADWPSMTTDSD